MQWNKNLLFGVLVDNTRRLLTPMRGSEKYHATRRISLRIIYQKKTNYLPKDRTRWIYYILSVGNRCWINRLIFGQNI